MLRRPDHWTAAARSLTMRALGVTVYRRLEWYEREFGAVIPLLEAGVPLECGFLDLDEALAWTAVTHISTQTRCGGGSRAATVVTTPGTKAGR